VILEVQMMSLFERGREKTNLILGAADVVSSVVGRDLALDLVFLFSRSER
jgi:hypothetical protein